MLAVDGNLVWAWTPGSPPRQVASQRRHRTVRRRSDRPQRPARTTSQLGPCRRTAESAGANAADARHLLWIANGCLLAADVTDTAYGPLGPGPCPRSELADANPPGQTPAPRPHCQGATAVCLRTRTAPRHDRARQPEPHEPLHDPRRPDQDDPGPAHQRRLPPRPARNGRSGPATVPPSRLSLAPTTAPTYRGPRVAPRSGSFRVAPDQHGIRACDAIARAWRARHPSGSSGRSTLCGSARPTACSRSAAGTASRFPGLREADDGNDHRD